jgi:methyltransferase type 11
VEEIHYASKLSTEEIEKYRIVANEIIPLCKKKL